MHDRAIDHHLLHDRPNAIGRLPDNSCTECNNDIALVYGKERPQPTDPSAAGCWFDAHLADVHNHSNGARQDVWLIACGGYRRAGAELPSAGARRQVVLKARQREPLLLG